VRKTLLPDERRVLWTLLAGRRLELDHQFSGYPPAVFHLDALRLGPLADLSGVQPAGRSPAPAAVATTASIGPTGTASSGSTRTIAARSEMAPVQEINEEKDQFRSGGQFYPSRTCSTKGWVQLKASVWGHVEAS
jgi:hypothetical protein